MDSSLDSSYQLMVARLQWTQYLTIYPCLLDPIRKVLATSKKYVVNCMLTLHMRFLLQILIVGMAKDNSPATENVNIY